MQTHCYKLNIMEATMMYGLVCQLRQDLQYTCFVVFFFNSTWFDNKLHPITDCVTYLGHLGFGEEKKQY